MLGHWSALEDEQKKVILELLKKMGIASGMCSLLRYMTGCAKICLVPTRTECYVRQTDGDNALIKAAVLFGFPRLWVHISPSQSSSTRWMKTTCALTPSIIT